MYILCDSLASSHQLHSWCCCERRMFQQFGPVARHIVLSPDGFFQRVDQTRWHSGTSEHCTALAKIRRFTQPSSPCAPAPFCSGSTFERSPSSYTSLRKSSNGSATAQDLHLRVVKWYIVQIHCDADESVVAAWTFSGVFLSRRLRACLHGTSTFQRFLVRGSECSSHPLPPSLYTWDMGLGKILVNAVPLLCLSSVSASPSTVSSSSCALLESLTGSGLATSIVMCCHWVLVQFLSAHLIFPPP